MIEQQIHVNAGQEVVTTSCQVTVSSNGGITRGRDIPAAYADAIVFLGLPQFGTLPVISGGTYPDGTIIEGVEIRGRIKAAVGARVIVRDSCYYNGPSASSYAVDLTAGGGCYITLERVNGVQRTAPNTSKHIAGWGDANLEIVDSVLRGGTDIVHFNATGTSGRIPTGRSDISMARFLARRSWFGGVEKVAAVHVDLHQYHDQGRAFYVSEDCRFMAYGYEDGADPMTAPLPYTFDNMAATCVIVTKSVDTSHDIVLDRCWFEGGNYPVALNDVVGYNLIRDCEWGLTCRYGPLSGGSFIKENNRWGQTGTVTAVSGPWQGVQVSDGDLI